MTLLVLLAAAGATGSDLSPLVSPGYLVLPHAPVAAACDRCHVPFRGLPDARCLRCHAPIERLRRAGEGFHGGHADAPCVRCHTDHTGRGGAATREAARAAFDHGLTGFPLEGRHRRAGCDDCHDRSLDELRPACTTCHEDAHAGTLGARCAGCHAPTAWNRLRRDHGDHELSMRGRHGELACADCHFGGTALEESVVCSTCHARAHGGTRADCAACHRVDGWRPAAFDHGPCGCAFPGRHQTAPCLACHEGFRFTGTPSACEACHLDDLGHDPLGPCARCHSALSWSRSIFDHDRTDFPLEGAHLSVSCRQCHPEPDRFGGASTACESCHAGDGREAHPDFGPCARCHVASAFSPSTFDHRETGFVLTGRHAEAGCWDCHPDRLEGYPR